MKGNMKIAVAVTVFVFTIALSFVPKAQAACSDASLSGEFGITWTGTNVLASDYPPGLRAGVGILTFNGVGGLSGSVTKSKDGVISEVTGTGTYTVSADCAGSVTVTDSDGEIRTANFVIISGLLGVEVFAIQTDSGRVVTMDLKKIRQLP